MATSVVIPALNEAGNIARVVAAARAQAVDEVIVVDNGSSDATAAVAAAAGAVVMTEPRRGYGYACAAGSAAAHGDILVYLDGDGSFLPAEMARLIEPLRAGAADLVLGSRCWGTSRPARCRRTSVSATGWPRAWCGGCIACKSPTWGHTALSVATCWRS